MFVSATVYPDYLQISVLYILSSYPTLLRYTSICTRLCPMYSILHSSTYIFYAACAAFTYIYVPPLNGIDLYQKTQRPERKVPTYLPTSLPTRLHQSTPVYLRSSTCSTPSDCPSLSFPFTFLPSSLLPLPLLYSLYTLLSSTLLYSAPFPRLCSFFSTLLRMHTTPITPLTPLHAGKHSLAPG